ncbi:MAG: quinoprotein dehydrogenase-associated SoxYZ-like carrier [Gammaproteobacteria bacterium]
MRFRLFKTPLYLLPSVLISAGVMADVAPPDWRQQQSEQIWQENIRSQTFQQREIIDDTGNRILQVKAPFRAEDATIVPMTIHTRIPQTADSYIEKMHVFVDRNPVPLVGLFEFTTHSGKADLAMRIRVDNFTFVRAIAELNTGELYMSKTFVRATGACSAPPPKSIDDSIANMGQMKMRTVGELALGEPNLVQLRIKHPNITGLQPMKIGSRVRPPPHFVSSLQVDYEDQLIMKAQLTFSVSMDPSLRFFFVPEQAGKMKIQVKDTSNNSWESEHTIQPGRGASPVPG